MAGEWVAVDVRLIEALEAAEQARRETAGRFDPTILPALVAAGYDRSYELLTEHERAPLDGWRAGARIDLDLAGGRARIERGAAVDLGGIGKGFAATRALAAMRVAWPGATGVTRRSRRRHRRLGRPARGRRVEASTSRTRARPVRSPERSSSRPRALPLQVVTRGASAPAAASIT